ncbi:MAG: carboxylesterase/lipase family protein [Proteobacteria bacterium]|nr:carboxylesterase/lipase family protein [Pseudomonadota bacterium]MBU4468827.1 carboxylesterase/lipase family protein [Pseudomonadota bacterium]MCG2750820.1 carboxylesterase/lipase family protein [Desulfobacteraceae bacterium]
MAVIVSTDKGQIAGVDKTGYQGFLGIPFAKPPVGPLRFCAPQPCAAWSGVYDASTYGSSAPQAQGLPGMTPAGPFEEDCLYLNVYTPAADGKKRTVMFWIHGGAFTGGSGTTPMYHGGPLLSRHDVVLVTINYRLGALGYLDLSGIGGEKRGAVANCGQLDQIAALKWVQKNIEAFGGNPEDVTLFGESAGSMAVATLLAMPEAKGLFKKAICQSGGANNALSKPQADDMARAFMKTAGVETVEALWDIPCEKMVDLQAKVTGGARSSGPGLRYVPVYETSSLPFRPIDAISNGASAAVPLIVGNNRDEEKLFTRMLVPNPPPMEDETLIQKVTGQFPETVRDQDGQGSVSRDKILKMIAVYKASREKMDLPFDNNAIIDAIGGDSKFRIPGMKLLEAQGKHQPNVFCYLFTWESPARRGALGACHALDLPFVFGTYLVPGQDKFAGTGPGVEKLSLEMMDAWAAFAKTGNPSHGGIGTWEPYDTASRKTMIFGKETRQVPAPFEEERTVWFDIIER